MDPVLEAPGRPFASTFHARVGSSCRPDPHAWISEIDRLMHIHERAGMIPHSEFALSAVTLGVSAETVAIRFAEATARAWRSDPIRLSRREVAVVSDTAHFGAAIAALRTGGRSQSSAALERALWIAPGLRITPLLERERDRRTGTRAATTRLAA